jgi:hypothetical protein
LKPTRIECPFDVGLGHGACLGLLDAKVNLRAALLNAVRPFTIKKRVVE